MVPSPLIAPRLQPLSKHVIGQSSDHFTSPNFWQRWPGNAGVESCKILSLIILHMFYCSETMRVDQAR